MCDRRQLGYNASRLFMLVLAAICSADSLAKESANGPTESIRYNRDIRPILSRNCFSCHGPDEATREADLALHRREDAVSDRGGYQVLVPGGAASSELIRRITTADDSERMPPADEFSQLTADEIDLLRRWIEEGATYEKHWSFIRPQQSKLPTVKQATWPRNPLDFFVLKRVESAGLRPAPRAARELMLRRVSFALTGLPPSLEELDSFLADEAKDAYEKVVERLLASPRYGEHRARYWLDAARFADTNGFFTDGERSMWRWRDWVIDAFNNNMPFDQFTIAQLAGDLLPAPSESQKIATAFNRNHMTMYETGVVDEEYRVEYVVDRLATTSTVWMGLTIGCARCHDHKFDPITQREFYQLFAFFNTVAEQGIAKGQGNAPPTLPVQADAFLRRLATLEQQAVLSEEVLKAAESEIEAAQTAWLAAALRSFPLPAKHGLLTSLTMDQSRGESGGFDEKARAIGNVEVAPGIVGDAARFDGDSLLEAEIDFEFERTQAFSYGAWVHLESGRPACVVSKNDDLNSLRGFDVLIRKGKAVVHLVHRWNSNAIQVTTELPFERNRWKHLMVTYDGSSRAAGIEIYIDGEQQKLTVGFDSLTGSTTTDEPIRIGRRSTSAPFVGLIDDVRIYNRELTPQEVWELAAGQLLRGVGQTPLEERTDRQRDMLRQLYFAKFASHRHREVHDEAVAARRELSEHRASQPTVMVMQEMDEPRATMVLNRGQYDAPGEAVNAGVPRSLPAMPQTDEANRLTLARWLTDPSHPLTARVTVNRLWQQLFGRGIVETVEDFGSQGAWPSHPELLDWLAVELVESGWDLKHIQRLIVTSAAFQQSSNVAFAPATSTSKNSPDSFQDVGNRLLARGPRFRLAAEGVRDNALAISGLLVESLGGPSVKPYQPAGLWEAVSFDGILSYQQDHGGALHRRGLYTFWKRQSPPPGMLAFDAPTRETCVVRRARTNTPLQALALMNDVTFVEAARALAERMLNEVMGDAAARVRHGFRLATSHPPSEADSAVLVEVYKEQHEHYRENPHEANRLIEIGESPRDRSLDECEHAAWTVVASLILNLDETISRP